MKRAVSVDIDDTLIVTTLLKKEQQRLGRRFHIISCLNLELLEQLRIAGQRDLYLFSDSNILDAYDMENSRTTICDVVHAIEHMGRGFFNVKVISPADLAYDKGP